MAFEDIKAGFDKYMAECEEKEKLEVERKRVIRERVREAIENNDKRPHHHKQDNDGEESEEEKELKARHRRRNEIATRHLERMKKEQTKKRLHKLHMQHDMKAKMWERKKLILVPIAGECSIDGRLINENESVDDE